MCGAVCGSLPQGRSEGSCLQCALGHSFLLDVIFVVGKNIRFVGMGVAVNSSSYRSSGKVGPKFGNPKGNVNIKLCVEEGLGWLLP